MDRARAKELLREHEGELDALDRQMVDLRRQTSALRSIVEGYRALAGDDPAVSPKPAARKPRARSAGPGLKRVLEGMLRERRSLSIEQGMDTLAQLPAYADAVPSRNTVGSRLGDLVREGKAKSDGRGNYDWLESSNGSDPAPQKQLEGSG